MSILPPSPPPSPLTDDALLEAFETTSISAKDFHHREHVRVVWKLIRLVGKEPARERFVTALVRLARAHGADQLYHETLTRAWVELISEAAARSPWVSTSEEFFAEHPELLDRSILNRHFSPELLATDEARTTWLPPDRQPFRAILASAALSFILFAVLLGGCSKAAAPPSRHTLLVVGIDGGEWKVIERLWAKGELPNLHALANRGVRTRLKTAYNSSPVIWTTIATGVIPKRHGITDFVVPTAQGDLPVSSGLRKVPAIWNMTTTGRRNTAVLGWWASWPAEPIRGVLVSDRILLDLPNRVSPPEVLARFQKAQVAAEKEPSFFGLGEESERRDRSMSYFARELLAEGDLDLMLLYFRSTDVVSHRAWKYFEPKAFAPIPAAEFEANRERVPNVYRAVDVEIGKLLEIAPDANVLVISDHGFHATAREEETKVLLDLDAVLEHLGYLAHTHKGGAIDFARTRVFSYASSNFRQARFVRFALAGREKGGTVRSEQRAALRARLVEDLADVTYIGGEPVFFVRDARPKEITEGADFVIGVSKVGASETLLVNRTPWKGAISGIDRISGTHTTTTHGILIAAGPDIDPKANLAEIDVHDITPTLLYGLGLPVAQDFDGEAYPQLFLEEFRQRHPMRKIKSWGVRKAESGRSSKADDQLLDDLRSLGYIQ